MPIQLSEIQLDRDASIPLARQLYMQLHQQILGGHIGYKERLPTSRTLASELKLSRGVVVTSYEMLKVDGLISGFGKGGTLVSYSVQGLDLSKIKKAPSTTSNLDMPLSSRGHLIANARQYASKENPHPPLILTPSVPDFSLFPYARWQKVSKDALLNAPAWYQREGGVRLLKKSLQTYLAQYRGIYIDNLDSLLITTGSQAALSILARLLAEEGDSALIDQLSWPGAKAAMQQAGLHVISAPVDEQGTRLSGWTSDEKMTKPRIVIATPSCQFPTGCVMSVERREAFIRYTAENHAWLIEDDYAAEYSYAQHPAPSLCAHIMKNDAANHIIHVGTMSKLLLPGLRLGWMVVPEHLSSAVNNALNTLGIQPSYMIQQQLGHFMQYGYLSAHLTNTRNIYNERRRLCSDYLQQYASDCFTVMPSVSGMNHYLKIKHNFIHVAELEKTLRENGLGCDIYTQQSGELEEHYLLLGHANLQEPILEKTLDNFLNVYRNWVISK